MVRPLPAAALVTALTASAANACPHYNAAVDAVQSEQTETAADLYETIILDPECGDPLREWVADHLARATFLAAMAEGVGQDDRRDGLKQALAYETHWRSYAELGRLAWSQKNYGLAAHHLQLAINELAEGDQSHAADASEIEEVYQMATAAMALADTVVDLPRTRSGTPGGIFQTTVRGFTIEEVQLPITFEYNSVEFDAQGAEYAAALVEHLKVTAASTVELGGHTDPRGSDSYNMDLSQSRADALGTFLQERGFEGQIVTRGYGETRIPTPPEGIEAGSEEHFRIARRVAFKTQ